MKIIWEVEDGYIGKSRPQYMMVSDLDLKDFCSTKEDAREYIFGCVQDDFDDKISWAISNFATIEPILDKLFPDD